MSFLRALAALTVPLVSLLVLAGCGGSSGGALEAAPVGGTPEVAPVPYADSGADCSSHATWREAQDALDVDPSLDSLATYGEGVACQDELAQPEFEDAWFVAYSQACEAIFEDPSDGALFGDDGTEYASADCENPDPGPGDWDADAGSEPEDDGHRAGWEAACATTFEEVVCGGLQREDEGLYVTQSDCER